MTAPLTLLAASIVRQHAVLWHAHQSPVQAHNQVPQGLHVCSIVVQPFDVVRTRMQAEAFTGIFRSTPATFRILLAENGMRGLWRGTTATVTRLAFGAGCHFFFLDAFRPLFEKVQADGSRTLSATGAALTGASVKPIATRTSPVYLVNHA